MATPQQPRARSAFTLVELLVSMAVLLVLLVGLVGMVNQTSSLWRNTNGRIEQYRQAREGFEAMTRRLSQATLNTYLDYVDANGNPRVSPSSNATSISNFVPARYIRQSELRLISGPGLAGDVTTSPPRPTHAVFFQAPLGFVGDTADYGGLENLLNTWGYYVEFNNNGATGLNADKTGLQRIPSFVKVADRYRFRLMEMMQPSESLSVYNYTSGNAGLKSTDPKGMNWFTDGLAQKGVSHVLADNIIALVILPKLSPADQAAGHYSDASLAPNYTFDTTLAGGGANDPNLDSRNQLPPLVTVTMVALDETTYSRAQGTLATIPPGLGMDPSSPPPGSALFQSAGDTKDPASAGFAQDLQTLEGCLQAKRIGYRVFTTDVGLKAAKWSRAQTK